MNYWFLSFIESAIFIGMFLISIYLLIPKSLKFWHLWKKTDKMIYFCNAVASGVAAFFLLAADFLIFIKALAAFHISFL